jgi:hypothetical protein
LIGETRVTGSGTPDIARHQTLEAAPSAMIPASGSALRALPSGSWWETVQSWRHGLRRRRKLRASLRAADAIVVTSGKSGRTWLRVMISHVYHRRAGIAQRELINDDNFHKLHSEVPKIVFGGSLGNENATRIRQWTTELSTQQAVVLLVRDPRDVVVSRYFHLAHRATPNERLRKGLPRELDLTRVPIFHFACDKRFGLPYVVAFMNIWAEAVAGRPRAVVVRYEDLRHDPVGELGRVFGLIDPAVTPADLEAAVDFASFEAMRRREAEGFFGSERVRPGRVGEQQSFKVREGRVGGYRDHFSIEECARLDRYVMDRLRPDLGYTGEGARAPRSSANSSSR